MKHLIIYDIKYDLSMVRFKIMSQTHRLGMFGINDDVFIASNGIYIKSMSHLFFSAPVLFVRGKNEEWDNVDIQVTLQQWNKIKYAVKEYNNYFGFHHQCIIGDIVEVIPKEMFEL